MGSLWLKIKIWTKVVVASFLLLYLTIFVIKNSDRTAKFWYWFYRDFQTPLLFLVLFSFAAGVLLTVLSGAAIRTVRQIREIRSRARTERLEGEIRDLKQKAAMLQTQPAVAANPTSSSADIAYGAPEDRAQP